MRRNKNKTAGLFGADNKPIDESRGPKTLYGMTIAYFRGDGGPGLIEQPHKLTKTEYHELDSAMSSGKNLEDILLLTSAISHKQGDHFTLTTRMLINHTCARIAYIQLEKFEDDGKGVIVTPADQEFYTPKMKLAKGYEGWNDPTNV